MSPRWAAAAWFAATVMAAQAQPAPAVSDPESQLQAIREALVDATVGAPVRVQSYGWIDPEGRLHESTQFTSDIQVRGVRLPSYLSGPESPEQARRPRVDAVSLPVGVGQRAPTTGEACEASTRRWRQRLHVEVVGGPGLPAQGPQATHRLLPEAQRAFLAATQRSIRWVAQARPYQPATAYEKALLGRDADRTEWLARVELSAGADGLGIQIEVAALGRPAVAHRLRMPLTLVDSQGAVVSLSLDAAMAQAVAALDRLSACDPMGYSVASAGEALRLREGAAHGLQAGDRLLLVERQYLPGRLLEPGAVRAMALVQVAESSEAGTLLRWLAGPRPANPGDWVALPL